MAEQTRTPINVCKKGNTDTYTCRDRDLVPVGAEKIARPTCRFLQLISHQSTRRNGGSRDSEIMATHEEGTSKLGADHIG